MTGTACLTPALLLLALAGCPAAAPSTDTAADEQAIRALIDGMNTALGTQNDSLVAATFAEDALLLPPGRPRVSGRANIRALFAAIWPLKASLSFVPGTIRIDGDLAIEEGTWVWSMPGPHGTVNDHGNLLVIWHRTDTSWEVTHDIWNSTLPPTRTR
jgi:uncharacterized protein (TIGR02246 family)